MAVEDDLFFFVPIFVLISWKGLGHARQTRNVCWYLSVSAALNKWTFMMRLLDLLWMLCWRDTMVRRKFPRNVEPYLYLVFIATILGVSVTD